MEQKPLLAGRLKKSDKKRESYFGDTTQSDLKAPPLPDPLLHFAEEREKSTSDLSRFTETPWDVPDLRKAAPSGWPRQSFRQRRRARLRMSKVRSPPLASRNSEDCDYW